MWLAHTQNHLWHEVWPAAPCEGARGAYWHRVRKQVHALFDGGGGGMQAAGDAAAAYATADARAKGLTGKQVAKAAKAARKAALGALRAATTMPATREHLYQVGEYQMQDCSLSEPFEVSVALVVGAYACFARTTGCLLRTNGTEDGTHHTASSIIPYIIKHFKPENLERVPLNKPTVPK